ncbi:MAG TPA: serine/threonine-protein kinase, partial [Urbifossiella sp.]|nr:serine/threonine-protein kinase [Urbifossiella sp.]
MPEVGDEFQGFRLVEELGRGTFGRVFLARQAVLAGRLVALKVTNRPTREPDRLARLQHTNVVPVYSVHTAGQCQLICMPFLGRRTLADALKSHRSTARSSSGWSGRVTRAQRGSTTVTSHAPRRAVPKAPPASPGPREAPADLVGDPAAVLRLLSQLAAGLDHAHGRGILHLDIKPGNVLIADTGEPMLLDFNLSVDASEADRELVGGTVPYMAPEQLQDMRSRGRGGVDARTDLYSLGVVAYELLAGEAPFPGTSKTLAEFDRLMAARKAGPPPLRSKNPAVTPAVEAVVRKLLAPDPAARYQSAADLKDDIDRQLADRPLRFARDRSVAERVGKWRRRNPRVLIGAVVALVVVAAGGSGAYAVQAADGRSTAEARIKARDAQERMHTLRVDLTVPDEPMYLARGVTQSRDLLGGYGLPDDANWRDRESFRRLPDAGRAALATDFGELLVLLGSNRLALATDVTSAEAAAARDEAARCVRAAADCFADGPTPPALTRLARELGLTADAAVRPVTARDYFLDAAGHTRSGRYAEAVPALEEATLLDPGHAAAQFLLAHSLACVGRTERAAERFAVSAGLMKTERRAYRQWGWAEMNSGQPGRAVRILDRAAGMSSGAGPDLRYLLGLSRLKLGKYEEAYADLTAAAAFRPVSNLLARAEARERLGDAAGAAADRRTSLAVPTASPFDLTERGSIQEATDPAGARADYRRAVAAGPSF